MPERKLIREYDPNWQWGEATVEVVLMQWGYSATHLLQIGGNSSGLDVLRCAVSMLHERLWPEGAPEDEPARLTLTNRKGETLLCEDEEGRGEDWLEDMVVSLRIVGYQRPTLNHIRKLNGAPPKKGGDAVPKLVGTTA